MGARGRIAVLICALAALALPAVAAADARGEGGSETQHPGTGALVFAGTDNGYSVLVGFPSPRIAVIYALRAERRPLRASRTASYVVRTRSRLVDGVLSADFGPIGRVSGRFVTRRSARAEVRRGCTGPRSLVEAGRFRGRIALRGEGGYFRLRSSSAPAFREQTFRLRCRPGRAANLPAGLTLRDYVLPNFRFVLPVFGGSIAQLRAEAKVDGRGIFLLASHEGGAPAGAEVEVTTIESDAGMAVGRTLAVNGRAGTLTTSLPGAHPGSATLAPPSPFHGAAEFFETSTSSHRWSGPLKANLPGLTLPLTGPRFYTSLCVLSPLKSPNGCDFTAPKPLVPERLGMFPGWGWAR